MYIMRPFTWNNLNVMSSTFYKIHFLHSQPVNKLNIIEQNYCNHVNWLRYTYIILSIYVFLRLRFWEDISNRFSPYPFISRLRMLATSHAPPQFVCIRQHFCLRSGNIVEALRLKFVDWIDESSSLVEYEYTRSLCI